MDNDGLTVNRHLCKSIIGFKYPRFSSMFASTYMEGSISVVILHAGLGT